MLGEPFGDVLRAAQAGAGWAFTRLYEDLAGQVTGYLRHQGAVDPDDLASETFLHVFRGLPRFEGDEAGFRSWVFTIAHRRLVDDRRRRGRRPATTPLDEVPREPAVADPAEAAALESDAADRVRRHLDALTPSQRDVVLLRVVAGLDVAETATVVGRSEDAVRQLQRRGLRVLAERIAPRGAPSRHDQGRGEARAQDASGGHPDQSGGSSGGPRRPT